jgi:hypothetical protein
MTYITSKYYPIKAPFSKGYVDNVEERLLEDGSSPYLRNVRSDGAGVRIRPGHAVFATLGGTGGARGLGTYVRSVEDDSVMVVRKNVDATHKLQTVDESGTVVSIVTGANITSDARMFFTNGADVIYCYNGVDAMGKLSGTTYTLPASVPAGFKPKFGVIFNGSHWVVDAQNPSKVYKSVGNNYDDFTGAGSDIIPLKGDCVGLAATNQTLYYFTKEGVYATGVQDITTSGSPAVVSYFVRDIAVSEGAQNMAAIVPTGDLVFYLTPSNKIMRLARGQSVYGYEVADLTHRLYLGASRFMSTLAADQSEAHGVAIPRYSLVKWNFSTAGKNFNDVSLVYDLQRDSFFVDSNKMFYDWTLWNGQAYSVAYSEPKLYKDEYGTDDEDAPVQFIYTSKRFDLGDPTMRKEFWESRAYVNVNALARPTQTVYIDGQTVSTTTLDASSIVSAPIGIGTAEVGTFSIGDEGERSDTTDAVWLVTKGNLRKRGKYAQFKWTCGNLGAKFSLRALDLKAEMLSPETANISTGTLS